MKTFIGFILLIFCYNSIIFSQESLKTSIQIDISLKDDILSADIHSPDNKVKGNNIYLNISIQDTPILKGLEISFDSEVTHSNPLNICKTKYFDFKKTDNLNFKVISWTKEVTVPGAKEIWNHYIVLFKHSNRILFWVESETETKICKMYLSDTNSSPISIIEARNSLLFAKNQETQSALVPIVPATLRKIEETNGETYCFNKDSQFVPNIFGFLITLRETFIPLVELFPSDAGSRQGVQINILTNDPVLPSYEILIAPGDTVTSYNKKKMEIWGKACFIEKEKGVYNILGFIDIHTFKYKDKNNKWNLAFYSPLRGYLQLNGKMNTIFNSVLYGDTIDNTLKIKGLCRIEDSEYFDFEIPSCVESKIPIPERLILNIPSKKGKQNLESFF